MPCCSISSLFGRGDKSEGRERTGSRRYSRQNHEYFWFMESQNRVLSDYRPKGTKRLVASAPRRRSMYSVEDLDTMASSSSIPSNHNIATESPELPWHSAKSEFYATEPDRKSDDFRILRLNIARGTTCKVHLVQHKPSAFVGVMKILSNRLQAEALTEYNVYTIGKDSPFLVTAVAAYRNDSNFYIFMEYAPFRTLDHLTQTLKGVGSDGCRLYALEIACGLEYLHSNHIIHRDVKPENMYILATGHVVLGDFGSAYQAQGDNDFTTGTCGTYVTRPPEVWAKQLYGTAADIWMLGISLFNVISNRWPFLHPIMEKHIDMVNKGKIVFGPEFGDLASDLVTKMVNVDPLQRPTAGELMTHPYFDGLQEPFNPPISPEELLNVFGNTEDTEFIVNY